MKHLLSLLFIFSFIMFIPTAQAQENPVRINDVNIIDVTYDLGTTNIRINNNYNKTLKLTLKMKVFASETESDFIYETAFTLDSKQKTLTINELYYCKAEIEIVNTKDQVLARKEISDGEWIVHNPEDVFVKVVLTEDRSTQKNSKLIERSIVVVPRLYRKIYLSRTVNNSDESFSNLEFYSEGLNELRIRLECKDGDYELSMDGMEDGQQVLKINDAKNIYGEPCTLKNLIKIHFELKGYQLAMPIKLVDLQFNKTNFKIMDLSKNENTPRVFPNPTNGILHIQMNDAGTYRFELRNAYHQVYLKILDVNGDTQLNLPDLPSGTYFYKISNDENEWVEQLIVL